MSELNNSANSTDASSPKRPAQKLFRAASAAAILLSALLAPAPAVALDLSNARTPGHVAVPGVNAHFIPAPELTLASEFDGFESRNRRIEVIVAYIEAPIAKIEAGFTGASFKSRGMELKSSGDFTINGERAVLYKVLHSDGSVTWGKWVMLAGNGPGTLVVNAMFVSGDAAAASDLEKMLKGLYMEPMADMLAASGEPSADHALVGPSASGDTRPVGSVAHVSVSRDVTSRDSGSLRSGVTSWDAARDRILSGDFAPGSVAPGARPAINSGRARTKIQSSGAPASGDRSESASALALGAVTPRDETSKDERVGQGSEAPVSGDLSPDLEPRRRSGARIITEDGIVIGAAASGDARERARPVSGDVTSGDNSAK